MEKFENPHPEQIKSVETWHNEFVWQHFLREHYERELENNPNIFVLDVFGSKVYLNRNHHNAYLKLKNK